MKYLAITLVYLCAVGSASRAYSQWEALTSPLEDMNYLINMHFINDSTGFVLQQSIVQLGLYNRILKTTDYGETWDTIQNEFQINAATNYYYEDIFFINEQIGWICGTNMPFILKTTDGGETWLQYDTDGFDIFEKIEFADEYFGIAYNGENGGTSMESFDGGLTWNPNSFQSGYDGSFMDACNYVTIRSSAIREYQNCQLEVIPFPTLDDNPSRNGRCIYMKNAIDWIVGSLGLTGFNNFGSILTTYDGGESFTILDLNFSSSISAFYFLNSDVGYSTATSASEIPCTLLKTTDGGLSWSCQETPSLTNEQGETYYAYFYDMDLRNDSLMYAMDQNIIYRTTNGGGPLGDTYTGIKVISKKTKTLTLYPNPSSSVVRLEVSDSQDAREVSVYNSTGQLILHANSSPQELHVAQWSQGYYMVVVRYDNEVMRAQVVVE